MKKIQFRKYSVRGQSLIELLIVIALLAILLPTITAGLITSREGKPQQERRIEAAQRIKESQEAIRSIREASWSNIETNGTYHPENNGNTWSLVAGPETINGITEQVMISDVFRDPVTNQIVVSGGTLDPSTKKITTTVSWSSPIITSISSPLYLTRYLDNATYIQTFEDDFNSGTLTDVIVTNTAGGEVTLGSGGNGDWCDPGTSIIATLDLPGNGVSEAVSTIEGQAFVGTGENASGESFINITISNDDPPQLSIAGTINGYKTNDVYVADGYALIATDDKNKDVVIIDLATNTEVGYYNGSNGWGWARAEGVYVTGSIGYVVIGTTLQTFDLSSYSGSRSSLDSEFLWGVGQDVVVVDNYAYIALEYLFAELRLVDVSNPSSISLAARADVNGERGLEVFVNETGTRAYLATDESSSKDELFIINTDYPSGSKSNPFFNLEVISSYDANGMDPRGITVVPGNKAILVGIGGEEYQVIDISIETSPTYCGGLQVGTGLFGVASVLESDGDAYSYVVSKDSGSEFKVIRGGPGGTYSASGMYESTTFDLGYSTAFNRIVPTFIEPANTDVQFQIAVVDAVGGSCSGVTYEFVGPNGTSGSYYTDEDVIAFDNDGVNYENPARCFRYRVFLSTNDSSATPIFEEISINHSP